MTSNDQVVVYAPTGRDAALACGFLTEAGISAETCETIESLLAHVRAHTGAVVVAEEALTADALRLLGDALEAQPPWSDIPVLLLAGPQFSTSGTRPLNLIGPLRNVMVLERPVRRVIFVRAVEVALRSRRRQFEMRAYLESRSELLRREQELNRLKDEFLMTVSHELRTPLTAIVGWARMLATGDLRDSQRQRAAEIIDRNATAQTQLVSDLLDVSRAISGKTRLNLQPTDVRAVVSAAVDTLLPAAAAKQVRIRMDPGTADSVVLMVDPERLQQVVWNLLSNAVKFTGSGGAVDVRLVRSDGAVEIVIADTGIGIPEQFLPYVFDRFRQAEGGTTRLAGGLGLGLAIVKHLVQLHGGTVAADSPGAGKGSVFRVRLPERLEDAQVDADRGSTRGSVVATSPAPLEGDRVLVIDDDPDTRELFVAILERAGARVQTAASVVDGLYAVTAFAPDAIICDIEMPSVDGYALIPRLRDALADPPPALAVTAHARPDDRDRAIAAGFTAHITKPVSPADLVNAVASVLHARIEPETNR